MSLTIRCPEHECVEMCICVSIVHAKRMRVKNQPFFFRSAILCSMFIDNRIHALCESSRSIVDMLKISTIDSAAADVVALPTRCAWYISQRFSHCYTIISARMFVITKCFSHQAHSWCLETMIEIQKFTSTEMAFIYCLFAWPIYSKR